MAISTVQSTLCEGPTSHMRVEAIVELPSLQSTFAQWTPAHEQEVPTTCRLRNSKNKLSCVLCQAKYAVQTSNLKGTLHSKLTL